MSLLNRVLITVASIVIIVAGLRAASSLMGFILLAALLAISLSQLVGFIVQKGVPRSFAMLITMLVLLEIERCKIHSGTLHVVRSYRLLNYGQQYV